MGGQGRDALASGLINRRGWSMVENVHGRARACPWIPYWVLREVDRECRVPLLVQKVRGGSGCCCKKCK